MKMDVAAINVAHFNYSDTLGGAARATVRLINAFEENKNCYVRSKLITLRITSSDCYLRSRIANGASNLIVKVRSQTEFLPLRILGVVPEHDCSLGIWPTCIHKSINNSKADIINLHWVQGTMISSKSVAAIRKPLAWTLHDCWPFSGIHHYPQMWDYRQRRSLSDYFTEKLDHLIYTNKIHDLSKKRIYFVAPSQWIANEASKRLHSPLHSVRVIPNAVPTHIYKPYNKSQARALLGFTQGEIIILFVSASNAKNSRKGVDILGKLLTSDFTSENRISFVSVGSKETMKGISYKRHIMLGSIKEDARLALVYAAADITLVPSRIDNLPQVATESISCGTPVIAFNSGGLEDCVEHLKTGYLAVPFDIDDMIRGIKYLISDKSRWCKISEDAQNYAHNRWSSRIVASAYSDLYREMMEAQ